MSIILVMKYRLPLFRMAIKKTKPSHCVKASKKKGILYAASKDVNWRMLGMKVTHKTENETYI